MQNVSQTLFDKYGGVPVVTEIVRDFYKRVMRRPNLRRYFVNVTLEAVIHHQIAFVSMVMGKTPHDYSGRSMREAHRGIASPLRHLNWPPSCYPIPWSQQK